jgi:hypothetical protein
MSEVPPKPQTSASASLDGVHTRVKGSRLNATKTYVPVLSADREALMPTTAARARKWIKSGKATPFFRGQMFCVRMNVPTGKVVQVIAVGIDPGTKREGFTVKSEAHTYLNIQAEAVTWVSDAVKVRREARRSRRHRKTPYKAHRTNIAHGRTAHSSVARWRWKLRIATWLYKLFPIDCFVVEDVKAKTTGQPKWDKSFSAVEKGKNWFYPRLAKIAWVELLSGYETFLLREQYGLKKGSNKKKPLFKSHCVDSWLLANWHTGGHIKPDNEKVLVIVPIHLHRRQLHALQPGKNNFRRNYGGTRSNGFKRGSIIRHKKRGIVYVGGAQRDRISLYSLESGKRLCENAKPEDCKFLAYNSWRCFAA